MIICVFLHIALCLWLPMLTERFECVTGSRYITWRNFIHPFYFMLIAIHVHISCEIIFEYKYFATKLKHFYGIGRPSFRIKLEFIASSTFNFVRWKSIQLYFTKTVIYSRLLAFLVTLLNFISDLSRFNMMDNWLRKQNAHFDSEMAYKWPSFYL